MLNQFMKRFSLFASFCILLVFFIAPTASANTESHLLQTDNPEKLELHFPADWAGSEFELVTDAGAFPVPVTVDDTGVLHMDLGGSTYYKLTLKPVGGAVSAADSLSADESQPSESTQISSNSDTGSDNENSAEDPTSQDYDESDDGSVSQGDADGAGISIPPLHIIMFGGGLIVCIATLIIMSVMKRRRRSMDEADEAEDFYEDE